MAPKAAALDVENSGICTKVLNTTKSNIVAMSEAKLILLISLRCLIRDFMVVSFWMINPVSGLWL